MRGRWKSRMQGKERACMTTMNDCEKTCLKGRKERRGTRERESDRHSFQSQKLFLCMRAAAAAVAASLVRAAVVHSSQPLLPCSFAENRLACLCVWLPVLSHTLPSPILLPLSLAFACIHFPLASLLCVRASRAAAACLLAAALTEITCQVDLFSYKEFPHYDVTCS